MKQDLINKLLDNNISIAELATLCPLVNETDLADILQRIYDLNERDILSLAALTGLMALFDNNKNNRRNARFTKKIQKGFRDNSLNKIVLAEGDSWFNYPVVLTDVIDALSMDENLAVFSLAKGGDWLLNMLTGRKYVEELSVLHPDFFLISGGGNDIVGARRLAAIVKPPDGENEYEKNLWANALCDKADKTFTEFKEDDFLEGTTYLSKDFFALLMFFHLQFYFMMNGILNGGHSGVTKFPGITILTQGYDYPIPSTNKNFGWNPFKWYIPFVRLLLGHGTWLKIPLEIRGIYKPEKQRKVMYAMIFLFNEMMIQTGAYFNKTTRGRVFHIDSRGSVGENGWTDELHAQPPHFINTGKVFAYCIRDAEDQHKNASYDHVYVVTDILNKLK
ncbi:MAG TPA: hypothetical protein VGS79_14570 [Puia sp.]|nr:hypothetical protein [Puia sp.]